MLPRCTTQAMNEHLKEIAQVVANELARALLRELEIT